MHDNVLFIQQYKTIVFFVNYSILPSICCLFTNIYYVMLREFWAAVPQEKKILGKSCF